MAATSTQRVPSSSSSSSSLIPEVFLSHDLEDTGNHFTGLLIDELKEKSVIVFKDYGKSERELFKAIEESLYAVVVISRNYVFSPRCLRELTKIMERMRKRRLKVLSVFHDVNPFDVRNLRGSFEKAFDDHRRNGIDKEELESWKATLEDLGNSFVDHPGEGEQEPWDECRAALIEAGQPVGWHVHKRTEFTVARQVRAMIFRGLMSNLPDVPKFLVGMDYKVKRMWDLLGMESPEDYKVKRRWDLLGRYNEVKRMRDVLGMRGLRDVIGMGSLEDYKVRRMRDLLGVGSREDCRVKRMWDVLEMESLEDSTAVRFVGIYGDGGTGKTTLARIIYERVSSQFTARCFIARIGEASGEDLVDLQKYLMSEIQMVTKANKLRDWHDIKKGVKLQRKKVLIVLDDVRREDQVDALARRWLSKWFGGGSRIIITTRYRNLLIWASDCFKLTKLNVDDALELFCMKAFNKPHPEKGSERMILEKKMQDCEQKCVPLAVEVSGSCFYSGQNFEGMTLELQSAFDRLDDLAKEAFLDIACLFDGWSIDAVISKLESFGYPSGSVLKDLKHKSLIKFSTDGKLYMHDVLAEMGQRIAQQNRLQCDEDINLVLEKAVPNDVKGIFLDLSLGGINFPKMIQCFKAFSTMKNLRILRIIFDDSDLYSISLVDTMRSCLATSELLLSSHHICIMEWWGYPFKSLPEIGFMQTNLVALILKYSYIERLQIGQKVFWRLKHINLSFSAKLTEMPNLCQFPNLEILNLSFCERLFVVHPPTRCHERLMKLLLKGCCSLENLLGEIILRSLEVLDLSSCSKLNKFPDIAENRSSLKYLDISETTVKELPSSVKRLQFLNEFYARGIGLRELPSSIALLEKLRCLDLSSNSFTMIPDSVGEARYLVKLSLSNCSELKKLQKGLFSGLRYLSELDLSGCNLGSIPDDIGNCSSLSSLNLSRNKLTKLPESLHKLVVLDKLSLNHCSELKELPKGLFSCLRLLSKLDLSYCNLLDGAIPEDLGCCSLLLDLNLSGNKFTKLPKSLCALSILRTLFLDDCTSLQSLPNLPLKLFYLKLKNCPALVPFDQQSDVGIPSEMLKQCVCSSTVAHIGFEDKPYRTLYLHSQSPPWENDRPYYVNLVIACGPTRVSYIPKWFKEQSNSSREIKICMDWDLDSVEPRACALMIVPGASKGSNRILSDFVCQFGFNEASPKDTLIFGLPGIPFVGSNGMWVFINLPHTWRTSKSSDRRIYWVSIATNSMDVEFICGARLLDFSDDTEFFNLEFFSDSNSDDDSDSSDDCEFLDASEFIDVSESQDASEFQAASEFQDASELFDESEVIDHSELCDYPELFIESEFLSDSDFYKLIRWISGPAFSPRILHDCIHGFVTVRGPIKDE